ncbi:MAG: FMN-binding protein, partial [Muricoprocola sp.]
TEEAADEVSGTKYTAMAACYEGEMPVEVVINEEGKITAIKLPELETQGAEVQDAALEVTKQIIAAQSPNVDGVSGATVTSDGIKNAVAECLAEAGIEVEVETEVVEETETEEIEVEETEILTEEAATTEETTEGAILSAGEYTANAACYEGEMPVVVVINEEGKITAVKLPELGTQGAEAQDAALAITKEIVVSQSADVDGISGATITSDGIISAVAECLASALK